MKLKHQNVFNVKVVPRTSALCIFFTAYRSSDRSAKVEEPHMEAQPSVTPPKTFSIFFFFHIYKELRKHCPSVTQTHHLKTPLHESRERLNEWWHYDSLDIIPEICTACHTHTAHKYHKYCWTAQLIIPFPPHIKGCIAPGHESHEHLMHLPHTPVPLHLKWKKHKL